jgi:hypothetical protein
MNTSAFFELLGLVALLIIFLEAQIKEDNNQSNNHKNH